MATNRASGRPIEKLDSDEYDNNGNSRNNDGQDISRHNSDLSLRSEEKNQQYDQDDRPIKGVNDERKMSEQERRENELMYNDDSNDNDDASLAYRDPSKEALSELDQRFPPGQHPLEGLHNMLDLPAPEALNSIGEEMARTLGISELLGDYRTMCLFSKHWALREAALNKTM